MCRSYEFRRDLSLPVPRSLSRQIVQVAGPTFSATFRQILMETGFLDRLANQLEANKSATCRRAIQRILLRIKEHCESGQYKTTTDAENEFRRLVDSDLACKYLTRRKCHYRVEIGKQVPFVRKWGSTRITLCCLRKAGLHFGKINVRRGQSKQASACRPPAKFSSVHQV